MFSLSVCKIATQSIEEKNSKKELKVYLPRLNFHSCKRRSDSPKIEKLEKQTGAGGWEKCLWRNLCQVKIRFVILYCFD